MSLFQNAVLNKHLQNIDERSLDNAWNNYCKHFHNAEIQENIRNSKEEEYQAGFLTDLFVRVLKYTLYPASGYNLRLEQKDEKGSKKADAALLKNDNVVGVIELKGTDTTDLDKVESQAFGYKNYHRMAEYVIISNFEKLRFYINNAVEHIEFNLFELTKEEFKVLWLCLEQSNLQNGIPKKIKEESLTENEQVTKKLYADYSAFKQDIFESIVKHNPGYDKLRLFKKTQKLLDRFLFIFFAEDQQLLPPNSIKEVIKQWRQLKELDEYRPLYERFVKYFGYLNTGHKGKNHEIFPYNGGLFAPDEVLDSITIEDELLYKHALQLSKYDFASEVDVNILGHIFEHSLNEIEEISAELKGEKVDRTKTRRKKDGVYYTPKYITKYIVENTVGTLCEDKKAELSIDDEEYRPNRQKKTKKELLDKLEKYREWLLTITICDPACGSGAFLNQALEFLIEEHHYIDELQAKLLNEGLVISDIESSILENNLFGVDINEESVEIAKLSLWLRTAQKGRKLTSLNNNIKCGNSLIDDPDVAGEKAFDWEGEFPSVFKKGGFDVVIGNPPYGADLSDSDKEFLINSFETFEYQVNTYVLFYEMGVKIIKPKGVLGYITPSTFTYQHYFKKIRSFLQQFKHLVISSHLYEVFEDADIGNSVSWIIQKTKNERSDILVQISKSEEDALKFPRHKKYVYIVNPDGTYNLLDSGINFVKLQKNSIKLGDIAKITVGIKPYQKGKGTPKQTAEDVKEKKFNSDKRVDDTYIQCIIGKDFHRYTFLQEPEIFLSYGEWLAEQRQSAPFFDEEKVILRQTSDSLIGHLDDKQRINLNNVYNVGKKDDDFYLKYILALLNSKLMNLVYQKISQEKGRIFAEVKKVYLTKLPIKSIPKSEQKIFTKSVDQLISMNEELSFYESKFRELLLSKFDINKLSRNLENWHKLTFKQFLAELKKKKVKLTLKEEAEWMEYFNEQKAKSDELKTHIAQTDSEIDAMVYELYGLNEEEVNFVERINHI